MLRHHPQCSCLHVRGIPRPSDRASAAQLRVARPLRARAAAPRIGRGRPPPEHSHADTGPGTAAGHAWTRAQPDPASFNIKSDQDISNKTQQINMQQMQKCPTCDGGYL